MSSRLVAVSFDARDPVGLAAFWAELLGREVVDDGRSATLPALDTQVGLRFDAPTGAEVGSARLHLHLTSTSVEDQEATVERVLALRGSAQDGVRPYGASHVVVTDPEGNEFCVIEPGNRWLAGCGLLAEVTCDGGPEVGRFWADALDWPLVWDQDAETAIQSPLGGTKLSWDGKGTLPKQARNPHRFELGATDPAAEVDRLVSLGATRVARDAEPGGALVELTDPEGNELRIAPD